MRSNLVLDAFCSRINDERGVMKRRLLVLVLAILMVPAILLADDLLEKAKNLPVVKGVFSPQVKLVGAKDLGDIYELEVQRQEGGKHIIYATKDGAYLIVGGNVLNKDKVNLTQVREEEINRVDFSTLPVREALKITKGDGAKKLVMFADVECPYCKRAYDWLKTQNNYTLYIFFDPLNIHPQSNAKTLSILCAKDRLAALDKVMAGQEVAGSTCPAGTQLLANQQTVVNRVGVDGTPLFITGSGARIVGLQIPQLQAYLNGK